MNLLKIFIYILLIYIIAACVDLKDNVVLRINETEVLETDFIADMYDEKNRVEIENKQKFTKTLFNTWLNNYINEILIYNEALKSGINNDKEIDYICSIINKLILVQDNSDFYKKITEEKSEIVKEDLIIFKKEIEFTYEFELIIFESIENLNNVLKNEINCQNINDYNRIKKLAKANNIFITKIKENYPYNSLLGIKNVLVNLNINSVFGPLKIYNYPYDQKYVYIRCVNKTKSNYNSNSFKDGEIYAILHNYENPYLMHKKLYEIYETSKFKFNDEIISRCFKDINYINNTNIIDTISIKKYLDINVFSYLINGSVNNKTIRDLYNFHSNLFVRNMFINEKAFKDCFLDILTLDYLWLEAEKIGYTKTVKMLKNISNLEKKVTVQKYLDRTKFKNINIKAQEVQQEYYNNIKKFSMPEYINYEILAFKKFEDAFRIRDSLNRIYYKQIQLNEVNLNGLIEIEKNKSTKDKKLINYTTNFFEELFKGNCSQIYVENGFYKFALKTDEVGLKYKQLHEVEQLIYFELLQKKQNYLKMELINKLKNNSEIIHTIKYEDYLQ